MLVQVLNGVLMVITHFFAILPARERGEVGATWYAGTADAIYQNISFLDQYDPEYVLILSGDHIYKMDYEEMLNVHKEKKVQI